jgi:hypothetical protein
LAAQANAFGAEYLRTLLTGPTQATGPSLHTPAPLVLPGVPDQGAVERALALYEAFVQVSESVPIEVVA